MDEMRVKISEGGRVVIPAEYRKRLDLKIGDELVIRMDKGELRLFTPKQGIKKAQNALRRYVSPERSLADELIAERREEDDHD